MVECPVHTFQVQLTLMISLKVIETHICSDRLLGNLHAPSLLFRYVLFDFTECRERQISYKSYEYLTDILGGNVRFCISNFDLLLCKALCKKLKQQNFSFLFLFLFLFCSFTLSLPWFLGFLLLLPPFDQSLLTTTRVMLSGRVSMATLPPPMCSTPALFGLPLLSLRPLGTSRAPSVRSGPPPFSVPDRQGKGQEMQFRDTEKCNFSQWMRADAVTD